MSIPSSIVLYNLSDATMKGLLPAGYTPLAYIEFTGTLHIDTGVKANQNTLATVIVSITSGLGNILLSRSDASTNSFSIFYNSTAVYIDFKGYDSSRLTETILYGNKYVLYNSASRRLINSTITTTSISGSFTTPTNLMLGAKGNDSGVGDEKLKGKVYYCSVSEGNTPKLDLRPARRDSDGVLGMYDLVSRTFKTNSGSGSFIAGPPLAIGKGGGKSLPEEYLLVEWLQGTGTQWIDTQVTCGTTDVVNTTWTLDSTGANGEWQGINGQMLLSVNNGSVTDGANTISISKLTNVEYNYNNGSSTLKVGSTSYTRSWGQRDAQPIYLWKLSNYSGSLNNCKISKFYATKAGSVVRNMYACYRKSDMKPGMYDTVNGVFYTNAGSGEFILGPTVNAGYTCEVNAVGENMWPETPGAHGNRGTLTKTSYGCYTIAGNSNGNYTRFDLLGFNYKPGPWTISFDAYATTNTSVLLDICDKGAKTITITPTKQRFYVTATATDYYSPDRYYNGFFDIEGTITGTVYISNLCLMLGDRGTTYSPYKTDGLYTNLSGIYDSSKGWVADFNGSSSTVKTGLNFSLYGSNFSIACWLKSNVNNGGYLTAAGNELSNGGIVFGELQAANKLQCYLNGTSGADINICAYNSFAANTWYHVVYTVQNALSSPVAKLYINGSLITSASGNAAFGEPELPIIIGCNGTYRFWNGQISNFLIFNVALTDAQVKELYGK